MNLSQARLSLLYCFFLTLTLFNFVTRIEAQTNELFSCNGSLIDGVNDKFFVINANHESATFTRDLSLDLNTGPERLINAIGFRWVDQTIYGTAFINPKQLEIFALNQNGAYQILDTIQVLAASRVTAGAVTNDQKFLVITEIRETDLAIDPSLPTLVHKINLEDGNFTTETITSKTTGGVAGTTISDIAFDPVSGVCYGFNELTSSLVTIDIINGTIDNNSFPALDIPYLVSSLFFDPFGRLFGVDKNPAGVFLYEFDKITGEIIAVLQANEPSGLVPAQDGCSCPFTVAMEQTVTPDTIINCQEIEVSTHIAYWNEAEQSGLTFQNSFPNGCVIQEVVHNPYGGTITGIGSNVLRINDIAPTYGLDSIIIRVFIPEIFPAGPYSCQAQLSGFDAATVNNGQSVVYSDFRPTGERYDATPFFVSSIDGFSPKTDYSLCPGEQLILRPVENNVTLQYQWFDGSTSDHLIVDMPGDYDVTISNGCTDQRYTLNVVASSLSIDLGENQEIPFGATIQLSPEILSSSPIQLYKWTATDTTAIDCANCPDITVRPQLETSKLKIEVINTDGCSAEDEIIFRVVRSMYAPNAFSPNRDGINDYFFLQTPQTIDLNYFRIFDRWGNLIFEQKGGTTNSAESGWDGSSNGRLLPIGVYIWVASIRYPGNIDATVKGEILLVN